MGCGKPNGNKIPKASIYDKQLPILVIETIKFLKD